MTKTTKTTFRTGIATSAALCVAASATADFTGIASEASLVDQTGWPDPDARTLYSVSVYAEFDNAADKLIAVFGDADHIMTVTTSDDDGFWQFTANGSQSAGDYNTSLNIDPDLAGPFPSILSDSWVTIGLSNDEGGNALQAIGINFDSFNSEATGSTITVDNGSWFITPEDDQGTAGNYSGDRVLVGQFTVAEGETVSGSLSFQYRDSTDAVQYVYAQAFEATASAGDNAVKNDFNGDGVGDMLYRNVAGAGSVIYTWLIDASNPDDLTYTGDYVFQGTTQLSGWEIAGIGDMTGDGLADICWRDPQNRMYVWKMAYDGGTGDVSYTGDWLYTGTGLATWTVADVGDMTGDGIADLLWRSNAGAGSQVYVWIVDASNPDDLTYTGDYLFNGTTQLEGWEIGGIGDMTGNGIADVTWRDPQNRVYVWEVAHDAGSMSYTGDWLYTGTGLATWSIERVGDMTGDGIADIVWRSDAGEGSKVYLWLVDNSASPDLTYTGDYLFNGTTQLTNWTIAELADMTGDGVQDLVWRNPVSQIYVWKSSYDGAGDVSYTGDWLYQGNGLIDWTVESP